MYQWHAKVHKSGSKVAVFNGTNLVKVVDASKETFEPAEAQKFAEELVKELHGRSASQMTDGNQAPSVTTTAEEQQVSLSAVNQQATGKGAGDSKPTVIVEEKADECGDVEPVVEEKLASENLNLRQVISNLKKKLSQERDERNVERKARRGLAIAKQMVVEGKLEDSYDSIKSKVAEIVKLEESEIDRLEKKVAGEQEFDSIDDASKEVRRQARIARINRQAAAEAQEDGDESQADQLDKKADEAEAKMAHVQQILDSMKKKAEATETPAEEKKEEATETPAEEKKEEKSDAPVVVEEKKEEKVATETPAEEKKEEATETPAEEKKEEKADECNCDEKTASATLARKYRSIAANHRKLAEKAEAEGDIAAADKQDELADDAEGKAEEVEQKLATEAPAPTAPVVEEKSDDGDEDDSSPVVEDDDKKEAIKKQPGTTVTSSKHKPLVREGAEVEESFGIDKNASLVEQNDFANDPEVELLSKMWRGSGKDDE